MSIGQSSFNSRVSRIEGSDGLIPSGARGARKPHFLTGIATGLFAYILFVLGAWHLEEWPVVNFTTAEELGWIALGTIIVGWIVRSLLKIEGKGVIRNHLIGIILAFGVFHMGVHAYPEQFEMAFAPEWVEQTITTTSAEFLTPDAGFLAARDVLMTRLESVEGYQELVSQLTEDLEGE
ncbi:hypothetical protein [Pseudaestuariivita rosea]|uniref:hypothetical protein n=1 Tax=Pseudaestuariivita rosea TaxID=2763263 RepID=UPI001ABACB7A|nr:hypothetical protein [Pseudaestuariivita rosea]